MTVSSPPDAPGGLIGRNDELGRVDAVLDRVRVRGGALVVRGEPGIGKSALLDRARDRASALGTRTLATVGVESESELAFAGLHQLLRPIGSRIEGLPDPQRHALDAAFGVDDVVEPDPFRVALAAYRLISDAADSAPLLLIADDSQWLDRSSLDVLTFIARRLDNEPVVFIASLRDGFSTALEEAGLPILQLERLSASDSEKLLDRVAPGLSPDVHGRVLAEAAGNPLGLVELARAMPESGDPVELLSPAPATLTARLERAFGARLDGLGEDTRVVLLAAALDGSAQIEELLLAATLVSGREVALSALDRAAERGLAEAHGSEVRFHHPLIRSAVDSTAPPAQRLAMYAALAEVVRDPERRLWHRAACAVGYDEEVASALEEQAQIARRRGAVMVAAAALERAAMLTADSQRRGERLVRAAELVYDLGRVDVVNRLLSEAEVLDLGPHEAARLAWLQQMIGGDVWSEKGAAKTFVTIANELLAGDPDAALRSLVPVAHRCWWTRSHARTRQYVVDAAEGFGFPDDDPRLLVVIALANPEVTAPSVRRRVARIRLHEMTDPVAAMYVGIAAEKAGDFPTGSWFLARAAERLRQQGRLGMLTEALVHYAWAATYAGDCEAAEAAGAEAAALARDTHQLQFGLTGQLVSGLAAALRGREADAILSGPEQSLRAMNGGPLLAPAHLARGAEALSEGRHDHAFQALWPVFDEDDPAYHRFMRWPALLDLVEAGGRDEHAAQVAKVTGELGEIASRSEPPILCAGLACARPLLSDDDHAEALFVAALGEEFASYPLLRARTQFSYGRWLRRQRRSADARSPLRAAINLFDALGATRWSERARQELRASGEKIGERAPDAARPPHRPGAANRRAGGGGPVKSRDRRAAVPLPPHHRIAPLSNLPEARDYGQGTVARRARTARGLSPSHPRDARSRDTPPCSAPGPTIAVRLRTPRPSNWTVVATADRRAGQRCRVRVALQLSGGSQMRGIPRRLGKPSPATLISLIALFVSLSGVSYAAAKIGSSQIKDNSIQSKDIRNKGIALKDLSTKTRKGLHGARGPTGAKGAAGPAGRSALSTLQSGERIYGTFALQGQGPNLWTGVSFQVPAPAAVDSRHVVIAGNDTITGDGCTGSKTNPVSSPGYVCIYPSLSSGTTTGYGWGVLCSCGDSTAQGDGSPYGFLVQVNGASGTLMTSNGVWVYTAP